MYIVDRKIDTSTDKKMFKFTPQKTNAKIQKVDHIVYWEGNSKFTLITAAKNVK